jgi:hypothetical protein
MKGSTKWLRPDGAPALGVPRFVVGAQAASAIAAAQKNFAAAQ